MAESGERARFMNGYTPTGVEGSKLSRENPSPGVDDAEGGVRFLNHLIFLINSLTTLGSAFAFVSLRT